MRIAYVLTSFGVGGAERQVLGMARRMAQRGHRVRIFVLLPRSTEEWVIPGDLPKLDVVYLEIRKRPAQILRGLLRGAMELRSFRPDILHGHNFHGNLAARLLSLACLPAQVVSTIHNVYEGDRLRMLAYRLTSPLCRHTTTVSRVVYDRYLSLRAISTEKSSVLLNGIEVSELLPDESRQPDKDFVWLSVGRLAPAKDYPNLLHAFALLRESEPRTQLYIAGEGAPQYTEELWRLAELLGLSGAVHWLGLRRDVPELLNAADGFVLASAWEGVALAVGEAMAMEKLVVATDVGGIRELVGDAGELVPAKNPTKLAQAMLAMMNLPEEERRQRGRAARLRVCREFDMDSRAEEWEALYASVLK